MVAGDLRGKIGGIVSCFRKCDLFDRTSLLNWSYIRLTAISRISPEIFLPRFGAKGVKKGANDVLMPEGNPSAVLRESTRRQSRRAEPSSRHRSSRVGTGRKATAATFQPSLFPAYGLPGLVSAVVAAWGLVVSGDLSLVVWRGIVLEALRSRYPNERTLKKVLDEAARLFWHLVESGAVVWSDVTAGMVANWYWAERADRWGQLRPPAVSTIRNRQWVAWVVFKVAAELGAPVDAAALVGERVKRGGGVPALPLTEVEAWLVRNYADGGFVGSRLAVLVALAFSGGTASEIALVRMAHVDLGARTVEFKGSAARINPLDDWAVEVIGRFVGLEPIVDQDALLCVTGRTDEFQAAHSVTVRLGEVLHHAGLGGREGVTPRSIRLNTAKQILDSEGIEAAARFLGAASLDTAADALGHQWRDRDGR